jgi:hypothetical protein
MPVPPAVVEPLAEPRAGNLPAQLGPEPATGVASTAGHRALDVAQLGLDIRLAQQSAEEFNGALDRSIASIFAASMT